jgi:cell division protein FtsB
MTFLFSQILAIILAAFISLIALNKDLRSKTEKLQKEAATIRNIVFVFAIVSIANSILSYYNSENDKNELNKRNKELNRNIVSIKNDNDTLKKDNHALRKELKDNLLQQSKLITSSQQQSATDLKNAANGLHETINGSDVAPKFSFRIISDTSLRGQLTNGEKLPVYNFILKITNYDNFLGCKTQILYNVVMYNLTCFTTNTIEQAPIESLNAQSSMWLELPKFTLKSKKGKYLLMVKLRNKTYYEEAIYVINEKNVLMQGLRILELDEEKVTKIKIISGAAYELKNINWKKEFPVNLPFHIRDF